jgi:hypothetical protein
MEWSLSKKDLDTYHVVEEFRGGHLSRKLAAAKLGIDERSVQRKAKCIREKGILGIIHGNKFRQPKNTISQDYRDFFVALYRDKYFDFNFSHAYELLQRDHDLKVSYDTFRSWCRKEGLGKVRKRRPSKRRLARERASSEGLMWLLDGSPEKWNGKEEWSLIRLIDDATSKTPHAAFYESETTWGCMEVVRRAIEKCQGIPEFIVTDQAGWSTGSIKRQHFSQFVRACDELQIKVIAVNSPEAKGRVERAFRTDQDRLIPEMRLHGVSGMTDANRYLDQVYLPEWNNRRSVEPESGITRYRNLPLHTDLNEIFCLKEKRVVNRDQTFQHDNNRYRIENTEWGNMWKKEITVHEYKNGMVSYWYDKRKLTLKLMPRVFKKWKRAS